MPDDRALTVAADDRPLRHAVEVRQTSFLDPAVTALFRAQGVALVLADSAGTWPQVDEPTADFVHARLHGADELYASGYTPEALDAWADRVRSWQSAGLESYVDVDNDAKVRAPYDAMALIERCR